MEEKRLNEKESLELIARMIQNSRKNLQVGSGNQFLLWGWLGSIVSLLIMIMILYTKNYAWNWLWFAIPIIGWPTLRWQLRKSVNPVITYTDKMLKVVWTSIGTIGMCGVFLMAIYAYKMILVLPGVLTLIAVGVHISGGILENKFMQTASGIAFGATIAASVRLAQGNIGDLWWQDYLLFSICFIIMLVIPGYRLNKEAKACSKN